MAIAYIGGNYGTGTSASASVTHGQTISAGNLVVALVHVNGPQTITPDAGGVTWTEAVNTSIGSETTRIAWYYKIAGASEPSAYSFTLGASDRWGAVVKVFSGTNITLNNTPAFSRQASTNISLVMDIDGLTIPDDSLVVVGGGKDNTTTPGDVYSVVDNSFTGVLGHSANQDTGAAHRIYTTGTTFSGDVTITWTTGSQTDNTYAAALVFVEGGGSILPLLIQYYG